MKQTIARNYTLQYKVFYIVCYDEEYANPANTRRVVNAATMLGQRRRRWPNIVATLTELLVFAENISFF